MAHMLDLLLGSAEILPKRDSNACILPGIAHAGAQGGEGSDIALDGGKGGVLGRRGHGYQNCMTVMGRENRRKTEMLLRRAEI